METHDTALTLVLALAAGVVAQAIARRIRLPGIVVLLFAGVALGPDGIDWIDPRALGQGFFVIVDIAVAVILFEGGLNLELSRLRREQASIRRLVTWGALVTLVGGTLAAHFFLGWSWERASLFGSLVVVTGPTVIGPLVSELRLRRRVSTVLSAEGVLIDPIGAILVVLVLELVLTPQAAASGARDLLLRLGFGAAAGVAMGFVLAGFLRIRNLVPDVYRNIFVLVWVLVIFEVCDLVVSHSGILAVTIAGVVMGNYRKAVSRELREFKDQLTVLLVGLLFVLVAADVRYADIVALGTPGLAVVAALIFLVRPLSVAVMTMGSELSWRERCFVGWIAPRGIVAAAIASIVAVAMDEAGLEGGVELRALVFLTITVTVVQAGLTAAPVGSWLGTRLPGREGVAILGADGLGLALAEQLRAGGETVVLFDSNPQNCRNAEEAGFSVVFGNALEERTLQRGRLESLRAAIAVTPNQTVNGVFVNRAGDLFHVPEGYAAVAALDSGMVSEMVEDGSAEILFEDAHDVERWDVRFRHGEVEIVQCVFDPPDEATEESESTGAPVLRARKSEQSVILAVRRGDSIKPMYRRFVPREGDVAIVAFHVPDVEAGIEALADQGWKRLDTSSTDPDTTALDS